MPDLPRPPSDPPARAGGGPGYRVVPYASAQHVAVDWNAVMSRQHTIHGLLELDVTETRRAIHRHRRMSGQHLSFTALMVASFAHAIGQDPTLQAYRKGKGQVVVFDDVDVAVLVEQTIEGERVPVPHIVRPIGRLRSKSMARFEAHGPAATHTAEPAASRRCGWRCRGSSGGSR